MLRSEPNIVERNEANKLSTPFDDVGRPGVANAGGDHGDDGAVFDLALIEGKLEGEYLVNLADVAVVLKVDGLVLGEAEVRAFRTLHDTDESVGYRIEAESSFGLCTDLGCLTDEVLEAMSGVELAVIESNYDERMLCDGPYPVYLKRRILSGHGHLSNDEAGKLAVHLARNGAQSLILGHLSRENNRPELALNAVRTALREAGENLRLAAAPPLGVVRMEALERCRA